MLKVADTERPSTGPRVAQSPDERREARRRRVAELHGEGLTARAIGREIGVHHDTVARDLRELGLQALSNSEGVARARRARRRRRGIPEEKTCKKCGRMFTRSEVPRQRLEHWLAREHCSHACAHGPAVEERTCIHCGKMFKPDDNRPTHLACTRECAQRARRDRGDIPARFVRQIGGTLKFTDELPGDAARKIKLKGTKSPGIGSKYHPETREHVRRLRDAGRSWNEIAAEVGVPRDTAREMAGARQRRS
jgi:hypothetical protein